MILKETQNSMRVCEKVLMNREELMVHGPITIVAFGDSVTHGALANNEIDYETVYWNLLRKKINDVRNYVPVNVINAGIGATNTQNALDRMDSQVLVHNPDLIIICFGLNDVGHGKEWYISNLTKIFDKCKASGAETIFMTPNMLNTYVADDIYPGFKDYAKVTAEYQNGGRMDECMSAAVELAQSMDIKVCDCYSKWRELSKTEDTTLMLSNRVNHPTREMHKLFADSLFDIIFDKEIEEVAMESTVVKYKA